MKPSRWILCLTWCIGTSVTFTTFAATSPESCTDVADDVQRLACYDSAFGRRAGPVGRPDRAAAPDAGPAAGVTATATPSVVSGAELAPKAQLAGTSAPIVESEEEFGLSQQAKRERTGVILADSISAQVENVERNAADRLVVTLANGQVWVQSESTSRIRVKPGDTITIKRAALGSFMLVTAKNGSTRAKRVR